MATRWEVEKAVLWSDLEPPARLIVLALLTKADNDTAAISPDRTPALDTLTQMTGLARSAVTEWLNALEDAGWVKRVRPPAGKRGRTTYALLIGSQTAARRARSETRSRPVRSADQSARRTADQSAQRTPTSPPGGPASSNPPSSKPPSKSRRRRDEEPLRDDVEKVCEHLADRIEGNGSKRPPITKTWRTEARLLIDKDGRTADQILRCIDWCQADSFWRKNILSMPKLREKYDQLRLNAQGAGGHKTYRNPEDASAYHGDL